MANNSNFSIQLINGKALVIQQNYKRLEESLNSINNSLSGMGYVGSVIFDLLLSNGNNNTRFVEAEFDGQKVLLKTIKKAQNIDPNILSGITTYFKSHMDMLYNGILTNSEINRFRATL